MKLNYFKLSFAQMIFHLLFTKKIGISCFLLCLSIPLFAQKLSLSPKEDFNFRVDDFSVIGAYQQLTAVYRKHNDMPEIIFYTKDFKKEKTVALDFLPERATDIRLLSSANGILLVYLVKKDKRKNLMLAKLNADFTFTEPQLIDSNPVANFQDDIAYTMEVSEDKSKFLFYTQYIVESNWVLKSIVINEALQIQYQVNQLLDNIDFFISDKACINNNAEIFILATDRNKIRAGVEELKILACSNQKEFSINNITLNKHTLSDLQMIADNTNHLVIACGYYADARYSAPHGIFVTQFDITQQTPTMSHFIPLAMQVTSSKTDLRDMKIRQISLRKDGGIEFCAEKTYQTTRTISSINPLMSSSMVPMAENSRTVQEFNYDEVVIFNVKPEGAMAWSQTFLKAQMTSDDEGKFSSFAMLQHPLGKVYLFNDFSSKVTRLMACYISAKGELNMKEIQTSDEVDDWNIMNRLGIQVSAGEIVIPCITKNYLCFLKISF